MRRSCILGLIGALATLLSVTAPAAASPYFLIDSESEWQEALMLTNRIQPMEPGEWSDYMMQWNMHLVEGEPYPANRFVMPELYVWPGGGGGGLQPEDAGLVMVWRAGPASADASYSSAWKYVYGLDPDLTGSTINITVTAPQFSPLSGNQVNNVSFGIRDVNGFIRSWNWNCGPAGPIFWNTPTQITINPMILGVNAANPPATGFANNPMFSIVNSALFIVDENAKWVAQQGVPPPGQQIPTMWNYWHNLYVTPPIPGKNPDPIKWSQPPVEVQPGMQPPLFLGWDERSLRVVPPICADDWECTTPQPVTDIHWWGSFINWTQPEPPQLPRAFHLAIWTDVPVGPNNLFSHPGQMVWEHYCDTYTWNFAGYDRDPRHEVENEACFQFHQYLPEGKWFYQDPGPDGRNVYWLSIAAIYDDSTPRYPWGWKTRPHFWNDDAVRIRQVFDPTGMVGWPPSVGWMWAQGEPIMWQDKSWDLAFELTTKEVEHPIHDLGDAPDSSNSTGGQMTAYPSIVPPGVVANFPTVYQAGSPPHGPLHRQPLALAFLGNGVSLENEADIGVDQDPTNNIQPVADNPDQDLLDDGVAVPLTLPHCQPTQFTYVVTVQSPTTAPLYVNAWFDWNRDGDWDDTMTCPTGLPAPEWAVQNQTLAFAAPGQYVVTTPQFVPWHSPNLPQSIWMRITLSEQPWQPVAGAVGYGGCGPATGYEFGETEDYHFTPSIPEDWDWGDAPDRPYPTLAANNGASHKIVQGFCLGNTVDAENDGQPDANALGDDNNPPTTVDDEDGVTFAGPIIPGQNATVNVLVTSPFSQAFLDAWLDFDGNGSWADPGEQIAASTPVINGNNAITFPVPNGVGTGVYRFARFRLSSVGGLGFVGSAPDGEVEDHSVPIGFKWTQKPDLSVMGIDVNCTRPFILADDFRCTVTGPITDIHIWGSWRHDLLPLEDPTQVKFRLSIHKDIPVGQQGEYSRPGEVLWFRDFGPGDFAVRRAAIDISEGWMDPPEKYEFPGDHVCWRYDFFIEEAPFIQRGTPNEPVVYWLDVQAEPAVDGAYFGWKTSLDHWNDDAVWGQGVEPYPGPWQELRYPPNHEYGGRSIDLAFAITGEAHEVPVGTLTVKENIDIPDHFWWRGDPDPDNEMASLLGVADAVEGVFWNTITLTASGSGNDATDISAVNVWSDNDNDGKVTAADTLLGTGVYPVDDGTVTIALAPPPLIPAGGVVPIVVSYTMAPTAPVGASYQFTVSGASGTGQTSGASVPVVINPAGLSSARKYVGLKPISIGQAKKLPIGTQFLLDRKICTADFQASMGLFYIEEPNRSAGIGVNVSALGAAPVNIWNRVSVLGTCALINGTELVVVPHLIVVAPGIAPPMGSPRFAVGMNNKWTGGGVFGGQPATYDEVWLNVQSTGLNNVGMLVTTWGEVSYHQTNYRLPLMTPPLAAGDMFWINDGSNLRDGFMSATGGRLIGVACWLPSPYPGLPNVGEYWGVTGILRAIPSPLGFPTVEPVRMLVPRMPSDIVRYK